MMYFIAIAVFLGARRLLGSGAGTRCDADIRRPLVTRALDYSTADLCVDMPCKLT